MSSAKKFTAEIAKDEAGSSGGNGAYLLSKPEAASSEDGYIAPFANALRTSG
jgi:hypothetical protein